ncbi:hypothetical protein DP117_12165 [Brasilonema sp. UFV-L1]|nr:hypothetical protein [Brasilonema sp. UFV-L1]
MLPKGAAQRAIALLWREGVKHLPSAPLGASSAVGNRSLFCLLPQWYNTVKTSFNSVVPNPLKIGQNKLKGIG